MRCLLGTANLGVGKVAYRSEKIFLFGAVLPASRLVVTVYGTRESTGATPERHDVGDRTVELRQQHRTKQTTCGGCCNGATLPVRPLRNPLLPVLRYCAAAR